MKLEYLHCVNMHITVIIGEKEQQILKINFIVKFMTDKP